MACAGATLGFTVLHTVLSFERNNDVRVCQRADCGVMEKPGLGLKGSVDDIHRRFHSQCSAVSSITGKSRWRVHSEVACPQKNRRARSEFCLQVRNGY